MLKLLFEHDIQILHEFFLAILLYKVFKEPHLFWLMQPALPGGFHKENEPESVTEAFSEFIFPLSYVHIKFSNG